MTTTRVAPRARRWLTALTVLSGVSCLVYWGLLAFFTDLHWFPTALAYSPRHGVYVLPLFTLVASSIARARRHVAVSTAALVFSALFVTGYELPGACGEATKGRSVVVLTQNLAERDPTTALDRLVTAHHPDVILLQECKLPNVPPESQDLLEGVLVGQPDYHLVLDWNACILSRFPIVKKLHRDRREVWKDGGSGVISLYELETPMGNVWVQNVHLETIREGLNGFRKYKTGGVQTTREAMAQRARESKLALEWSEQATGPLIVAGDFNAVPESAYLRRDFGAFTDAFEECGLGLGFTKDTKVGPLRYGARIDHVLASQPWRVAAVDLAVDVGSDHRGVLATVVLE
jgi:endonuclease/exonuclease/phosphatase (EEP) superfamily protein YafD